MRVCDGCHNKMAPYQPRKRVGGLMLCKACQTRPGGGRVTAATVPDPSQFRQAALLPQDHGEHGPFNAHGQCVKCGYTPPTEDDEPCDRPECWGWPEGEHTKGEHIDAPERDPNSDFWHSKPEGQGPYDRCTEPECKNLPAHDNLDHITKEYVDPRVRHLHEQVADAFGGEDHGWLLDQNGEGPSHLSALDSGWRTEGPTTAELHRYQDGSIFLNRMVTDHLARGAGHGTSYLRNLLAQADAEGVAVHTVPGNGQLQRWYEHHGFEVNPSERGVAGLPFMTRQPKTAKTAAPMYSEPDFDRPRASGPRWGDQIETARLPEEAGGIEVPYRTKQLYDHLRAPREQGGHGAGAKDALALGGGGDSAVEWGKRAPVDPDTLDESHRKLHEKSDPIYTKNKGKFVPSGEPQRWTMEHGEMKEVLVSAEDYPESFYLHNHIHGSRHEGLNLWKRDSAGRHLYRHPGSAVADLTGFAEAAGHALMYKPMDSVGDHHQLACGSCGASATVDASGTHGRRFVINHSPAAPLLSPCARSPIYVPPQGGSAPSHIQAKLAAAHDVWDMWVHSRNRATGESAVIKKGRMCEAHMAELESQIRANNADPAQPNELRIGHDTWPVHAGHPSSEANQHRGVCETCAMRAVNQVFASATPGKLPGGYLNTESDPKEYWAEPKGKAPYDPFEAHLGLEPKQEGHGPWHLTRHPDTRAHQVVDNSNRLVTSYDGGHGSGGGGFHNALHDWTLFNQDHGHIPGWRTREGLPEENGLSGRVHMGRGLTLEGTERAHRKGDGPEDAWPVDTQHIHLHQPAPPFAHSTVDPEDLEFQRRARENPAPEAYPLKSVVHTQSREHGTTYRQVSKGDPAYESRGAIHTPSPEDEWHGPYRVIKHPDTGHFHVVDNQDRVAGYRDGYEDQALAERSRDHIDRRNAGRDQAKGIAEKLFNSTMEVLDPGGTPESRESERNMASANHLLNHYEPHHIKYDDNDEPYAEATHPGGWSVRHYGGMNTDIFHKSKPYAVSNKYIDGAKDNGPFARASLPEGWNHDKLQKHLNDWVAENGEDYKRNILPYASLRTARKLPEGFHFQPSPIKHAEVPDTPLRVIHRSGLEDLNLCHRHAGDYMRIADIFDINDDPSSMSHGKCRTCTRIQRDHNMFENWRQHANTEQGHEMGPWQQVAKDSKPESPMGVHITRCKNCGKELRVSTNTMGDDEAHDAYNKPCPAKNSGLQDAVNNAIDPRLRKLMSSRKLSQKEIDVRYAPVARLTHTSGIQTVAHDSGDGQTIYHCPFCGSGQVIARSDNTTECGYCHNAFTVQVQPEYPAFPQTDPITGQPIPVPGMPGQIDPATPDPTMGDPDPGAGDPNAPDDGQDGPPGQEEAQQGGTGDPGFSGKPSADNQPPWLKGSKLYLTASGHRLREDDYLAHLALAAGRRDPAVLAQVRASKGLV